MKTYTVEYKMEFAAKSARDAARQAFEYINQPGMSSSCFDVTDDDGNAVITSTGDDESLSDECSCVGEHDASCMVGIAE